METTLTGFINEADAGSDGRELPMLQLALPIPLDPNEKVRALTFLHETVERYIDDFCRSS